MFNERDSERSWMMMNYLSEPFLPCRRMSGRKLQSRERVGQELPSKVIYNTETTLNETNKVSKTRKRKQRSDASPRIRM